MDKEQIHKAISRVAKAKVFIFGVVDADGRLIAEQFDDLESAQSEARTRQGRTIAFPHDLPHGEPEWIKRAGTRLKRKRAAFIASFRISERQCVDSQRWFLTDAPESEGRYEVFYVLMEIACLRWLGKAATVAEAEKLVRAWLQR